jgi:hypothetical protein
VNGKQVSNGKDDHVDSDANVDAVQITIGNFGKWQIVVCLAISLIKFPVAWHQLAIVFMAAHQDYNCTEPAITDSKDQCSVNLNGTLVKCTEWQYDRKIFPETIISQVSEKELYKLIENFDFDLKLETSVFVNKIQLYMIHVTIFLYITVTL